MNFTGRQIEIINAAVELIAEKGIQKLTIKNMANKIGVAEGAIYRHFDSKIDILLGILTRFQENKKSVMNALVSSDTDDPVIKLRCLFTEHFNNFTENPATAAVVFSEEIFQDDKRLSDMVYKIMKENQGLIRDTIREGQEGGQIRRDISAMQLSLLITGALRLLVTQWRLSGYKFDLIEEGDRLWETIREIVTK
ncbi:MAG: TetR/AcrR family transcriptional regulator [Candidatus Krumholzibacteriales bacterium]